MYGAAKEVRVKDLAWLVDGINGSRPLEVRVSVAGVAVAAASGEYKLSSGITPSGTFLLDVELRG